MGVTNSRSNEREGSATVAIPSSTAARGRAWGVDIVEAASTPKAHGGQQDDPTGARHVSMESCGTEGDAGTKRGLPAGEEDGDSKRLRNMDAHVAVPAAAAAAAPGEAAAATAASAPAAANAPSRNAHGDAVKLEAPTLVPAPAAAAAPGATEGATAANAPAAANAPSGNAHGDVVKLEAPTLVPAPAAAAAPGAVTAATAANAPAPANARSGNAHGEAVKLEALTLVPAPAAAAGAPTEPARRPVLPGFKLARAIATQTEEEAPNPATSFEANLAAATKALETVSSAAGVASLAPAFAGQWHIHPVYHQKSWRLPGKSGENNMRLGPAMPPMGTAPIGGGLCGAAHKAEAWGDDATYKYGAGFSSGPHSAADKVEAWGDAPYKCGPPGLSSGPRSYDPIAAILRRTRPSLMCTEAGCTTYASFGPGRGKRATKCKLHKAWGMCDVVSRICGHEGCTKQPFFGYEGAHRRRGQAAQYCAPHKLPGMVNVRSPRCRHPGCLRRPFFGYAGDKRGTFCVRHSLAGMVSFRGKHK